jgi:hypothetical protein
MGAWKEREAAATQRAWHSWRSGHELEAFFAEPSNVDARIIAKRNTPDLGLLLLVGGAGTAEEPENVDERDQRKKGFHGRSPDAYLNTVAHKGTEEQKKWQKR